MTGVARCSRNNIVVLGHGNKGGVMSGSVNCHRWEACTGTATMPLETREHRPVADMKTASLGEDVCVLRDVFGGHMLRQRHGQSIVVRVSAASNQEGTCLI